MRRSAVTAAQTVALCMQLSKPGIHEGEIAARFGMVSHYELLLNFGVS